MDLQKIYTDSDFSSAIVPDGQLLLFNALEDGKPVTRYKDSNGNFATLSGGGGGGEGGGFELVKVTEYMPYRAELTATEKVVISGMGTIESEWGDSVDFSDVNGIYTVTDDTKYLSSLKRVYKQEGGKYYLRCYDPDDYEYPDYGVYWCITQYTSPSRWEAKAVFDSKDIPSGTNTWYSEMLGSVSIPTEVTNTTYPEQAYTLKGNQVLSYDYPTGLWETSSTEKSYADSEFTPLINNIYASTDNKLIGRSIGVVFSVPGDKYTVFLASAKHGGLVEIMSGITMMNSGVSLIDDYYDFSASESIIDFPITNDDKWKLQDFTFETVCTPCEPQVSYQTVLSTGDNWENNAFMLRLGSHAANRWGVFWNGYGDPLCMADDTVEYSNTEFHHVAICRSGDTLRLFDNGHLVASATISKVFNVASDSLIRLGALDVGATHYSGKIKWARISNIARYTEDFTPPALEG